MHITQTYLGKFGGSGLYVYYLYEDYSREQQALTQTVKNSLDDLGADFMQEVDLFRPNERFASNIATEIRKIPSIWSYCAGKLPGFLATYTSLEEVNPSQDSVVFFSIRDKNEEEILEVIRKIRDLVIDQIQRPSAQTKTIEQGRGFTARVIDSLEIKPGLFGVSIDLKRLIRR